MTPLSIVKLPDPSLRASNQRVRLFDAELAALVTSMRETMHMARGVGLAAPQIALNRKLAVLEYNPKLFDDETVANDPVIPFMVLANPTITHMSSITETLDEGCLSIPDLTVPVPRATEVHVIANNQQGNRVKIRAKGLLARILQHEIDHLNQVLIVDRTSDKKLRKELGIRN